MLLVDMQFILYGVGYVISCGRYEHMVNLFKLFERPICNQYNFVMCSFQYATFIYLHISKWNKQMTGCLLNTVLMSYIQHFTL